MGTLPRRNGRENIFSAIISRAIILNITFGSALERVVFGRRQEFALRPDGVNDYGVTPADDYGRHDEHRCRHYAYVEPPLPR